MTHTGSTLIDFLKKSTVKLEELQVQSALGKAELTDKLESVKKETLQKFHELKADAHAVSDRSKEKLNQLKAKMEHLELQLALGRAESKEEWSRQKKNISAAIHDLKELISKN